MLSIHMEFKGFYDINKNTLTIKTWDYNLHLRTGDEREEGQICSKSDPR